LSAASRRVAGWAPVGALAALCYVPLLLTHRGEVGADTKSYLTIDPSRLLERAWSMWDPNIGLGTVTHQNIGYLWPMGPWYWAFDALGVPDWITQRLWLGSILFLAGLGVRHLLRTLGQDGPHVNAAMFVYALSPYVLSLAARISAILLPFTALPWLIALTVKAIRDRTWWYPALFALVIATIGSTNATALLLVGLGPAMWVVYAVFVAHEATIRQAAGAVVRIGVLTVGASLWWMAGLYCQGSYGIDILKYSETARTVAEASTAPEVLRSLGYWFFYGGDKVGPWIEPSVPYTQSLALIFGTYLLAVLGLLAAGVTRWRYRSFFVALVVAGTVVAIGAHPWNDPPLIGKGLKEFLNSDAGLAMRSLPRAVPLLALGLAVLLGMGIASLGALVKPLGPGLAAGVAVLAVLCLPPLWTGDMVAGNLQRPEDLPDYWIDAAQYLEGRGRTTDGWATRVLEMPGSDFASYRWGNTVDPITPGLIDRPYVARELIPYGTPPSANLLNAFDGRLQEDTLDPGAIAPLARFMAVGDVVLRDDLQYERYNLARPRQTWALFRSAPGLTADRGFGGTGENVPDPRLPLEDELELASPPDLPDPAPVEVLGVEHPVSIFRAVPATAPVILAGDGDGLVDLAAAGLVDGTEAVLYSGSFAGDRSGLDREVGRPDAVLVLTDSNRRAGRRWSTVRENQGYTEMAGEEPLRADPTDNRLPIFPDAGDDTATVTEQRGGVHARATAYGNPITFTAEDRAANAVDDDRRTAWQVGAFSPVVGERIELTYDQPRTTDRVTLQQADNGVQNRWITRVRLRFDGGDPVDLDLSAASRTAPGQTLTFPRRTFRKLSIEVLQDDIGRRDRYDGLSSVGFADIRLGDGDRRVDEVIRLPRDLLAAAGRASADHPLAIVLTRQRTRPSIPLRGDAEGAIVRTFSLPTARSFDLSGEARLSPRATDPVIDAVLGVTAADGSRLVATSSRRLAGDIGARAVSAIDGDPTTHWSPGYLQQGRDSVRYRLENPVSFDHMDLRLVTDGRHSVPTHVRIEADGKTAGEVDIPALDDQTAKDATTEVPLDFPTVTGRDIRFVFDGVRTVATIDWVSRRPVQAPIGVAEIGALGLRAEVPSGRFDSGCRSDLVEVDGKPVPVRVRGDVSAAIAGRAMDVTRCGRPVPMAAGDHVVRTAVGRDGGIDIDQLVVTSRSATGRQVPHRDPAGKESGGPKVTVDSQGRDAARVTVGPRAEPTWFVLGQSLSDGWTATVDGRDLGPPTLIDGYANGWLLPAGTDPVHVDLSWTPQRVVFGAMALSAVAVLVCLVVVAIGLRRRRRHRDPVTTPAGDQPATFRPEVLWRSDGSPPSLRTTVLTVLVAAAITAVVIGPVAAVVVGASALVALRVRRARALTVVGPAVALAVSGLYTLVSQARHHLPAGFEWPGYFPKVHQVAYVGVALLLLDVVVDRQWTGRWWPQVHATRTTEPDR
jgi:arabinofuranan 3-O-arabinosyltransferase